MLMSGRDPAKPESYDHPIFATSTGDLLHLTQHGHGAMRFEYVCPGSSHKVGEDAPHDLMAKPANREAEEWLANAGSPL